MFIRPKDYLSIDDTLFFAVVSEYQEDDRALTWLRYVKDQNGMQKLDTDKAGQLIKESYPEFIFHSEYADIDLHGIPLASISKVHRPDHAINRLLKLVSPDSVQQDAINFIKLILKENIKQETIGVTGSLMLATHNENSDIDIVVYGRDNFFQVRGMIQKYIKTGELSQLDEAFWHDAYQRRDCSISFEEYKKHEFRKFNKCISGNTKVDISMIPENHERFEESGPYKKTGKDKVIATVINDTYAYDFPSRYLVDDEMFNEVVSYTATYTGQAMKGEKIEAAGYVEKAGDGKNRLLIGTSREAAGEYIRVINTDSK